ncbi:MAG: hypothetical protein QM780_00350 [Hyphomicrobium sp.]|uniref:hypothetical protein n=1 Tax=Hyphomicrobium sp. TaxID=82 RepID=UPI0039E3167B
MIVSGLRSKLLWLTLFAFGMQIAVVDFHHHVTRGTGIESRAMTAGMCRAGQDRSCAPLQKDHDGCMLCWATAIASTSLTPVSFDIAAPSVVAGVILKAVNRPGFFVSHFAELRARGPPGIAPG